jgi:RHS repeat-associated protein
MLVPNRHESLEDYRYGYQGSEKDDEIKGEGNSYFTTNRILDPRVGRWFSLDPVYKNNQSNYSSMSNNPITRVDPGGDDDYYNEKGKFLYRDNLTSNNLRLITQESFDKIHKVYGKQMGDKDHMYKGLMTSLDANSKIIKNTITKDHLKSLWQDSRMDVPLKYEGMTRTGASKFNSKDKIRRKEQSAIIVLDIKNGTLKIIRENDAYNSANHSGGSNLVGYNKDGTQTSIYGLPDVVYYNGDKNLVVIGNVHTHPFTKAEAKKFDLNLDLPYSANSADAEFSFINGGIPVYQIQINMIGKQLSNSTESPGKIGTHNDAMDGKVDIGRDALETSGDSPEVTYPSPDHNKGG